MKKLFLISFYILIASCFATAPEFIHNALDGVYDQGLYYFGALMAMLAAGAVLDPTNTISKLFGWFKKKSDKYHVKGWENWQMLKNKKKGKK